MKKLFVSLSLVVAVLPVWAQTRATLGSTDFAAERARLSAQRSALDQRVRQEQAACYQKFAVEDCLSEIRTQRRNENDDIRRQEASMNDIERKRSGAAALDELDRKAATPRAVDAAPQREQAVQSQQDREQRAAEHAKGREATAAESAASKRDFDNKQRNFAAEQAKAAQRRAEAPKEAEAFRRKLQDADEHRADVERKKAEQTKPRSAPLPPPP